MSNQNPFAFNVMSPKQQAVEHDMSATASQQVDARDIPTRNANQAQQGDAWTPSNPNTPDGGYTQPYPELGKLDTDK